jgi:hypothetical protein
MANELTAVMIVGDPSADSTFSLHILLIHPGHQRPAIDNKLLRSSTEIRWRPLPADCEQTLLPVGTLSLLLFYPKRLTSHVVHDPQSESSIKAKVDRKWQ